MTRKKEKKTTAPDPDKNADWQGVDKDPLEEKGKKELVTMKDLKGKKVDADPEKESDQPVDD